MDEPEEKKWERASGKGSRSPYKFDSLKQEKYLQLIREGMGRHNAARAVGVTPQLVCDFAKRFPEWKDKVSEAEMEVNDKVEASLFRKCLEGNPSCIFFWLQNRMPERWQDKRAPTFTIEQNTTDPVKMAEELKRMINIPTEGN